MGQSRDAGEDEPAGSGDEHDCRDELAVDDLRRDRDDECRAAASRSRLSAFDGPGAPTGPVIVASASASHVVPRTDDAVAAASSPLIQPQTEGTSCMGTGIASTSQPTVWKSAAGRIPVSKPA
jgi:hypothetical protein